MLGVASLNDRCKDALCHYELAWPPGERPTRPQWTDAALHTLKALGYKDHQYMIVAHDDKKHFHIHVMVNKVHPETLKAHTPYRNWIILHAAARRSKPNTVGLTLPALPAGTTPLKKLYGHPRTERMRPESTRQQPTGAAAQYEHYQDQESSRSYVRREVAPSVYKR